MTVCHPREEKYNEDPLAFKLCVCCGEPEDTHAHMVRNYSLSLILLSFIVFLSLQTGDLSCEHCSFLFSVPKNLQRHKSIEHPKDGIYSCCECDTVTSDREVILEHMKIHPVAKPYKCRYCTRDFTRKYHLDRHISQKGCDGLPKDEFQCKVCDKTFNRKDNLRDHLRSHAGQIKEKKMVFCTYCSKSFASNAFLTVHMRTHTGERPYKCDMCPKEFPSSGAMKKHRRKHTGERPYECSQVYSLLVFKMSREKINLIFVLEICREYSLQNHSQQKLRSFLNRCKFNRRQSKCK